MKKMESLTERLAFLMNQIFDDQINQLIMKNRLEKELVREREQKVNVLQSMMHAKNKPTFQLENCNHNHFTTLN